MNKVKTKWNSLDKGVQKVAKFLGAIATIVGIMIGCGTWIVAQVDSALAARIDQQTETLQNNVEFLLTKTDKHEAEADLTFMRLELMMLINTDPTNVVEIKKLYQSYREHGGNHYAASVIQRWCKTYYPSCDL